MRRTLLFRHLNQAPVAHQHSEAQSEAIDYYPPRLIVRSYKGYGLHATIANLICKKGSY